MKNLNEIVREVGRRASLNDFCLSENGVAALEFKTGIQVFFEYVQQNAKLFVYTPIYSIPTSVEQRLKFFEGLLTLNFLKFGMGNGEIAIFPPIEKVVYQIGLNIDTITTPQLDQAIDDLIEQHRKAASLNIKHPTGNSSESNPGNQNRHSHALVRSLMMKC